VRGYQAVSSPSVNQRQSATLESNAHRLLHGEKMGVNGVPVTEQQYMLPGLVGGHQQGAADPIK